MSNSQIKFENGFYSFVGKNGKNYRSKSLGYIEFQFSRNGSGLSVNFASTSETNTSVAASTPTQKFSINERFAFLEDYVSMVSDKIQNSVVIVGIPGSGKSTVVNKTLAKEGFVDISNVEKFIDGEALPKKHYKVVKGYSTPKALYRLLYENKNSILVCDDMDNILNDAVATNLLKGALDSSPDRIISWNAESFKGDDDLPRSFRFNGGVIFISNIVKEKVPAAIRSRSVLIDIQMTLDEKIDRMKYVMLEEDFMPEAGMDIKLQAMDIIEKYKHEAKDVSLRSLIQVTKIFQKFSGAKAEKLALYALSN